MIRGGCYCGGIRYEAGAVFDAVYCHCWICRRFSAAPVFAGLVIPARDFRVLSGEPASFASSDHGTRWFCAICGTQLHCTDSHSDYVSVPYMATGFKSSSGTKRKKKLRESLDRFARVARPSSGIDFDFAPETFPFALCAIH